jgi:hypothetical protein
MAKGNYLAHFFALRTARSEKPDGHLTHPVFLIFFNRTVAAL